MQASKGRGQLRVFLNASLSALAEQRLNSELAGLVEGEGHSLYLPQRELPLGSRVSAAEILKTNTAAILAADIVLAVLDKPGVGVAFELGVAHAAKKRVLLFRTDPQNYLGKILEGLWDSTPSEHKATTLEDLKLLLSRLSG